MTFHLMNKYEYCAWLSYMQLIVTAKTKEVVSVIEAGNDYLLCVPAHHGNDIYIEIEPPMVKWLAETHTMCSCRVFNGLPIANWEKTRGRHF